MVHHVPIQIRSTLAPQYRPYAQRPYIQCVLVVICMRVRPPSRLLVCPNGPTCSSQQPVNRHKTVSFGIPNPNHLRTSLTGFSHDVLPGCWAHDARCLRMRAPNASTLVAGARIRHAVRNWDLPCRTPACRSACRKCAADLHASRFSHCWKRPQIDALLRRRRYRAMSRGSCRVQGTVSGRCHVQRGSVQCMFIHRLLRVVWCFGSGSLHRIMSSSSGPTICPGRIHSSDGYSCRRRYIGFSTCRRWAGAWVKGQGSRPQNRNASPMPWSSISLSRCRLLFGIVFRHVSCPTHSSHFG